MPDVICERWEYWEPDPEIAELMGQATFSLDDCFNRETGKEEGYRVTRGKALKDLPIRLGRERRSHSDYEARERRVVCRYCRRNFMERYGRTSTVFCDWVCYVAYKGQTSLAVRQCKVCQKEFKPVSRNHKYCSVRCHMIDVSAVTDDQKRELIARYQAGEIIASIAASMDKHHTTIRRVLEASGEYRGRRGNGPLRTLKDIPCGWCKTVFSPQNSKEKYCSRQCYHADHRLKPRPCTVCGCEYIPNRGVQKTCSRKCHSELIWSGRKLLPITCGRPDCGKVFQPKAKVSKFCSSRCSVLHNLHGGGIRPRPCKVCQKVFKPVVSRITCCSAACGQRVGVLKRMLPEVPCAWCKVPFKRKRSCIRFCSRPCIANHMHAKRKEVPA